MRPVRRYGFGMGQPVAWMIVAGGLVVYVAAVLILGLGRPATASWLPWWAAQVVPPVVYGVLVGLWARPVSPLRWMVATCFLWAVHLVLGVVTVALGAGFESFSIVEAFPPPPWPVVLWVPLLLLPLREVITGGVPARYRSLTGERRTPVSSSAGAAWMTPRPVTGWPAVAAPSPARDGANGRSSVPAPQGEAGRVGTLDRGGRLEEDRALENGTRRATAVEAIDAPASGCLTEMLAGETSAHVRVSLARIVGQLPAEAFLLPFDQVGAKLAEPGRLLVPQRLVLAQLSEGYVTVGWDVLAKQFPRQALGMSDEEVAARLPEGHLVLPLDELVPQFPSDLFAVSNPPIELDGIDEFPAPFQPAAVEERTDELAEAFLLQGATGTERDAAAPAPAAAEDWLLETHPEIEGEQNGLPALEDIDLDSDLGRLAESEGVAASVQEAAPWPLKADAIADTRGEVPVTEAAAVAAPPTEGARAIEEPSTAAVAVTVEADPAPVPPPGLDAPTPPVEVSRSLAAAPDLDVDEVELIPMSWSSGSCARATLSAARRLLPLLADAASPWKVSQLTMRGPDAGLVLTPTGSGSVLVSTVARGESLAFVEFLALRAAGDGHRDDNGAAHHPLGETRANEEPDLVETEPPVLVSEIAASLDAIGPVVPRTLRRASVEQGEAYLFLPAESDVREVGRFARAVERAMRETAATGHTFHTAIVRCGHRRLLVHPLDGEGKRLVVVGGETDRPGLASRQVARATERLGTR